MASMAFTTRCPTLRRGRPPHSPPAPAPFGPGFRSCFRNHRLVIRWLRPWRRMLGCLPVRIAPGNKMSAEPQVRDDGEPSAALVRAYLEGLLGTAAFLASPRRRKLLAYLVERTLAGHGDR